jgi:hypothetical protein
MRGNPWLSRTHAWPWLLLVICLGSLATGIYPALTPRFAFAPSHDTTWLTAPMLCEYGRHYAVGRLPLLDWTTFEPVSHNLHISPLYPLYFAWLFDYCELRSAVAAHDAVIALHLFLLFANAVVLGRAAGLSWTGALMAGFVIAASTNAMALARWPSLIAAAAWMPLAAAGLVAVLHRGRLLAGSAMVVVGTSLMLMANPATNLSAPLTFFGLVLGAGAVLGVAGTGAWRGPLRTWVLCGLACLALIVLLSLGTSGNAVLALDDLVRWNRTGHVIGRQVTPEFAREILAEQQTARALLGLLLPTHPALVAGSFFLGGIVVALAALGALDGRREGLTRALVAMVAIVVLFVFLDPAEWVLLWSWIPGLNHTRHLSLLATPLLLATALLAGRGLEVVLRPGARRARRGLALVLAGAALLSFPASQWLVPAQHHPALLLPVVLACGLLALVLLLAGNWLASRQPHALAGAVLLCCGILVVPQLSSRMLPMSLGPAGTQGWEDLNRLTQRVVAADPVPAVLLFHADITAEGMNYTSAGTAARLAGAPTFQYFQSPRVFWQFFAVNYRFPDYAYYARHGARYMLAQGPVAHPALEEITREGAFVAYRLRDARPLVVPLCGVGAMPVAPGGRRPRRSQLSAPPPALMAAAAAADAALPACPGTPATDIRLDRGSSALRFALRPGAAQALVLNLPPHAGWRLTIGGRRVPLFTLDNMRMVAPLAPEVAGEAVLAFRPEGMILRQSATVGGWMLLLAALAWLGWTTWRQPRVAPG